MATVDVIEALIFASEEPLPLERIAKLLDLSVPEAQEQLQALKVRREMTGGLTLVAVAGGYRLMTKPEYGDYVAKLREPKLVRLSKAALEVLSIIAYKQPVTHAEVDQIRGVDSGHSLKTLVERDLVYSPGRKEAPGRPHLYATTDQFLEYVGINGVEELPDLEDPDADVEPMLLFRRRAEEISLMHPEEEAEGQDIDAPSPDSDQPPPTVSGHRIP